jgi:hypothetical protein
MPALDVTSSACRSAIRRFVPRDAIASIGPGTE